MEAALAAAKERKEKIQRAREEANRIAPKEECLAKEEAKKKAKEACLAKEAELVEAKWKAREDEAEAKARAKEEEHARHHQLAEKIANDAIAEMRAAEEKLIAEQKAKDKVAAAAKVAEGSWSGAWGGKKKEVNVGKAFPTKCGECVHQKRESCIQWSTKGTTCKGCHYVKVRCLHADQSKGVPRKRMRKEGGEGSATGSSTEFEDAILNQLDWIEPRSALAARFIHQTREIMHISGYIRKQDTPFPYKIPLGPPHLGRGHCRPTVILTMTHTTPAT
ncbi:hypothetical protein BT96DRAFT_933630 [Gymnopus androsaceus JB14]|uniref:Uncharacterized protein n=1 Tax=Gymnopus androsaceus JB14 TaxID=1447944 RepID=A0A6A4IDX2_9AGAR|nr:hypothetical protein BT96DRAFT_933630 [Gymnopus androsaceus JB14]